ncbi:Multidrug resistance protein Stp [Baekduia alba]|uniref:MFS transporter n=1 Tax=Baekduia alba TaxID=2997333 RepID=UPI002340EEDE|nr:MFS transporter [Baekduia alba]WCB95900.1 Multidrug resistance protein Stp [Baekduia alba]
MAITDLDRRGRLRVLAICCMSLLIVGLDVTIVNVALPSIRTDFNASVSELQWTIDAYTLVLASLLMVSGSTADRLGRVRVFQTGLVLFTLGSLACSLAPSIGALIAFRAVQAVGGSMLNPVAMSIIRNTFEDPRERAQAIGIWGGVVGISLALGPVIGGALVEISWRAIFLVNLPVGLLAIALAARYVPESRAVKARRVDPVGQVLVVVMLASLVYAIIEGPGAGWTSTRIVALFALSAAALSGLLFYEPRRREPLIELRFFRSAPFSGATLIAVCAFAAMAGFLFLNTLYLQEVRGFSALHAGLLTLPMAGMAMVFGPVSGRVVATFGPRVPLLIGGAGIGLGSLMLTELTATTAVGWLIAAYAVFGIGFGVVNPPITNTAVSGMPADQAGVAAAIASTSRMIGQSLGVAIVGAVTTAAAAGASLHLGFAEASHAGWWIVAGCGAAVFTLGLATTSAWALGTADQTARRLAEVVS